MELNPSPILKPREPWQIGIDPMLIDGRLSPILYHDSFRNSSREERIANAGQSLKTLAEKTSLSESMAEDILQIATAVGYRNEFASSKGNLPERVSLLLSHIYDCRWRDGAKYGNPNIPVEQKTEGLKYLTSTAKEHNRLYGELPTVEIPTGRPGSSIIIGYDASNWEGVGAVYFFLKDSSLGQDTLMPAFAVRGNPTEASNGKREFAIRGVQSWLSDRHSSVVGLRTLIEEKRDKLFPMELEQLTTSLNTRERFVKNFENTVFKHKTNSTRYLFVLTMAMAYLRNFGITVFNGVADEFHPDAAQEKKDRFSSAVKMSFDYDSFWQRAGFQRKINQATTVDEIHPWTFDLSGSDTVAPEQFPGMETQLRNAGRTILESIQQVQI
jgi:hypothetical protein